LGSTPLGKPLYRNTCFEGTIWLTVMVAVCHTKRSEVNTKRVFFTGMEAKDLLDTDKRVFGY
ncbi:MAG TPA: hypothetical protein PLC40_13970, partial [Candidatus Hydrogenedentes bacterium]|nr:hypothetical protein [Candidatus Hydrogenedentota bacterium]